MHEKPYHYQYKNYSFYADDANDMASQLTQLLIVAMDRNRILKKLKETTSPEEQEQYKFELQYAKKLYTKLRTKLEAQYDT